MLDPEYLDMQPYNGPIYSDEEDSDDDNEMERRMNMRSGSFFMPYHQREEQDLQADMKKHLNVDFGDDDHGSRNGSEVSESDSFKTDEGLQKELSNANNH